MLSKEEIIIHKVSKNIWAMQIFNQLIMILIMNQLKIIKKSHESKIKKIKI